MRDSFVFYRGFLNAIKKLKNDADRLALYDAIAAYALDGINPEEDDIGLISALMETIIPQIDANNKKYENGKKGGAPKGNKNASKTENNQNQPKTTNDNQKQRNVNVNDNVNVNVNDNGNDNDNAPESGSSSLSSKKIISYLNEKTGSSYELTEDTAEMIEDLISQGYDDEDLISVIDKKSEDWLNDPKMRGYLRPSTLFGSKFTEYLAAPKSATEWDSERRQQARMDLQGRRNKIALELIFLRDKIEQEEDPDRARPLYDQEAALSDQLQAIDKRLEAIG